MIARLLTHLTAAWDRILDACDVDRQSWGNVCHFPLDEEDDA